MSIYMHCDKPGCESQEFVYSAQMLELVRGTPQSQYDWGWRHEYLEDSCPKCAKRHAEDAASSDPTEQG